MRVYVLDGEPVSLIGLCKAERWPHDIVVAAMRSEQPPATKDELRRHVVAVRARRTLAHRPNRAQRRFAGSKLTNQARLHD